MLISITCLSVGSGCAFWHYLGSLSALTAQKKANNQRRPVVSACASQEGPLHEWGITCASQPSI